MHLIKERGGVLAQWLTKTNKNGTSFPKGCRRRPILLIDNCKLTTGLSLNSYVIVKKYIIISYEDFLADCCTYATRLFDQSEASFPESRIISRLHMTNKHLHSRTAPYQSLLLISVMSGKTLRLTSLIQCL